MTSDQPVVENKTDGSQDALTEAETIEPPESLFGRLAPVTAVLVAACFGLWELRAETIPVAYLNDSSVHVQMVRYAVEQYRSGHLPLQGWYPYLGLGSPQFLHYQSLGAMLTGLIGLVVGPNVAFSWSIYLLVSLWPLCIYACARLFGLSRWQAACAGVLAPFVTSATGVGYEQGTYLFTGFGVWTQLFGMWTLPLAWGFTWRTISRGRGYFLAALFVALTIAFHFMTGYLALLPIVLWPFIQRAGLSRRIGRSLIVGAGSLLASAWVLIPLIHYANWAALNESLQNTVDANSYGARQVLFWLVTGRIYDANRLPIITVLVGIGLLVCIKNSRRDYHYRAILVVWISSLVLFFGRPTLGPLFDALPGSQDLFLRRFIMGVQLSGLLIGGIGAVSAAKIMRTGIARIVPTLERANHHRIAVARRIVVSLLCVLILTPTWTQIATNDGYDASYIHYQDTEDASQGAAVSKLVAIAQKLDQGRIYAGLPQNWGSQFTVGSVPVFKYLANLDADEVGYTLRTQSLMTNPEEQFNEAIPADYDLFGIGYVITPVGRLPPVGARLLSQKSEYELWALPYRYVQVIDTSKPIAANRTDLGSATLLFVHSDLPSRGIYPTVAFAGQPAGSPTLAGNKVPKGSPGRVVGETSDLAQGQLRASVQLTRSAVVLLKASYDPGWTAVVDGKNVATEMIAPAYVGVPVPAGRHEVVFHYQGFRGYPWLFAVAAGSLILLVVVPRLRLRKLRSMESSS